MHWDGTVSFGNILTIVTTLFGFMLGGVRIAIHLERSSNAMNNLAAVTERLQHAVESQDHRLTSLETEQAIQKEVSKRVGAMNPVVQVNK